MSNNMIVNRLRELDAEPSGISDVALAAASEIESLCSRLAEAETALRIVAEQDWRYDELKARLAEAEAERDKILRLWLDDADPAECGYAADSASAVQPEGCCLDYPRCDCNSPPEPDNEWYCSQYPGCECFTGCREKAQEAAHERN